MKKSEEETPQPARENSALGEARDLRPMDERPLGRPPKPGLRLGQTLRIKGDLVGKEDVILNGEFEGTIDLGEGSLTVGPQGRLQANIQAREIIVEGAVQGNLFAADRLQISRSGNVVGDLVAARIVIEDGAYFKGSIDIQKAEQKPPEDSRGEAFRITPSPVSANPKEEIHQ